MAKQVIINAKIQGDAKGLAGASREAQSQLKDLEKSQQSTARSSKSLADSVLSLKGVLAGLGIAAIAGEFVRLSDQYRSLDTRIKTATKATGDYAKAQAELFRMTQANRAEFASTVELFQRLARAAPELGATSDQMLQLTNVVQQLGVIGGSTNEQMKNGLLQFSQAMSAGVVRAEEMNSILENTPEIAARIAKGMSLTVGELQRAVREGTVLSQDVFSSLLSQAPEIAAEMADIPLTVSQSMQQLNTATLEWIGSLDTANGYVGLLAQGISSLAGFMSDLADNEAARLEKQIATVKERIKEIKEESGPFGIFDFMDEGRLKSSERLLAIMEARLASLRAEEKRGQLVEIEVTATKRERYLTEEAATAAVKAATKAAEEQAKAFERLQNQLDPVYKAVSDYTEAERVLKTALDQKNITLERYHELMGALVDSVLEPVTVTAKKMAGSITEGTKAVKENQEAADPWSDAWSDALADIDRAFISLWESAFSGFEDFADQLEASFKRLLATLAHEAITRPILLNISAGMGLGGGGAVGAGGVGGGNLLSLAGLAGGMNAIGGGMAAGIASIGTAVGAPGAAGSLIGGLSSLGGGLGFTGAGSVAAGAGIAAAGAYIAWQIADSMIGANDFSGKRVTFGVGTGSGRGIDGYDYSATGASGLELSLFTRRADNMGISREQADAMLQSFVGADATLVAFANALGITPDFSGKTLEGMGRGQAGFYGSFAKGEFRAEDLENALPEFIKDWLQEIMGDIPEALRPFVERVDGSVEEMLAQLGGIAEIQATFDAITAGLKTMLDVDTFEEARSQVEFASMSIIDMWRRQGNEIVNFVDQIDDAADFATLTSMVQARYQTEIQLLSQVMGLLESIPNTFSSLREQITLDQLGTPEAQYAYFKDKFDAAGASLATARSPEEVQRLLGELNTYGGRAYGLLTDEQKRSMGGEFLAAFDQAEGIATSQANTFLDTIKESGTVIEGAIRNALDSSNRVMLTALDQLFARQRAADAQNAQLMNQAAIAFNAGTTVRVQVTNTGELVA